jgi:hypothetical protein
MNVDIFKRDKFLFSILYKTNTIIDECLIHKLLIITFSIFGDFKVSYSLDDFNTLYNWHDFLLNNKYYFEETENKFFSLHITCSVFLGNEKKNVEIPGLISIYGGYGKENSEIGIETFGDIYPNFINISDYTNEEGWVVSKFNNIPSAEINRKQFNLFLEKVKTVFDGDVIGCWSIYKKGTFNKKGLAENVEYNETNRKPKNK